MSQQLTRPEQEPAGSESNKTLTSRGKLGKSASNTEEIMFSVDNAHFIPVLTSFSPIP